MKNQLTLIQNTEACSDLKNQLTLIQDTFSHSLTPLFLTLLFFYFSSYVKDILEALTLGISFL